jgi:hypothetical protein
MADVIKLSPAARGVVQRAHETGLVVSSIVPSPSFVNPLLAARLWLDGVLEIADNIRGPAGEVVVFRLTKEGRELARVVLAS